MITPDWKLKLLQILDCFSTCEGTWYEKEWESFGVTEAERKEIKAEYEKWKEQNDNT